MNSECGSEILLSKHFVNDFNEVTLFTFLVYVYHV